MPKKLSETGDVVKEAFHYDAADNTVSVTQTQDDAPVRDYVRQQRLAGAKYVEGMGYEIATLPETLCIAYGQQRGLPSGWYLKNGYDDEMRKLIASVPVFNPHGKTM